MLILSRKKDEQILIGNDVVITVIRVERGQVKIGITAPKEVNIRRQELPEKEPSGN